MDTKTLTAALNSATSVAVAKKSPAPQPVQYAALAAALNASTSVR